MADNPVKFAGSIAIDRRSMEWPIQPTGCRKPFANSGREAFDLTSWGF